MYCSKCNAHLMRVTASQPQWWLCLPSSARSDFLLSSNPTQTHRRLHPRFLCQVFPARTGPDTWKYYHATPALAAGGFTRPPACLADLFVLIEHSQQLLRVSVSRQELGIRVRSTVRRSPNPRPVRELPASSKADHGAGLRRPPRN